MKFILPLILFVSSMCCLSADFKIDGGITYFSPQSSILRRIYGGGANYYVSASQEVCKNLDLWAGFSDYSKSGYSIHGHQKTHITLMPVSLGLKYLFPVKIDGVKLDLYLNGGLKYYFMKIHDHSDYVKKYTNKDGIGGVFGIGSYVYVNKHFFFNFLINYSFKTFHSYPHKPNTMTHTLQVGGWDAGGGVGLRF